MTEVIWEVSDILSVLILMNMKAVGGEKASSLVLDETSCLEEGQAH